MVGSLRLAHLEAEDGTKHIQIWRVGGAFSPGTTCVAVGRIAVALGTKESQLLHSAKPWGGRKRVWVCLGMLEVGLRSFLNGVSLNCSE
jgi:hypothetical protein